MNHGLLGSWIQILIGTTFLRSCLVLKAEIKKLTLGIAIFFPSFYGFGLPLENHLENASIVCVIPQLSKYFLVQLEQSCLPPIQKEGQCSTCCFRSYYCKTASNLPCCLASSSLKIIEGSFSLAICYVPSCSPSSYPFCKTMI